MEVLVSCIITSYKREKAIVERALRSVLAQTYEHIEVLIIDDNRGEGSEEYSSGLQKLLSLSDKVRVIKTETGHGTQKARNTGIRHGSGRYVAFLDDDDEWEKDKLIKQVKLLEENPDADLCYTNGTKVNENFTPAKTSPMHTNFRKRAEYRDMLRGDLIGSTSQVLIRKSVFDQVGDFDESFPARQDYEMWLRITGKSAALGIDEPLYRHYILKGEDQISRDWKKCIDGHKKLYEKYKPDIDKDSKARFNVIFYLAHYHMEDRNYVGALGLYIRSFFISPGSFLEMGRIKLRSLR